MKTIPVYDNKGNEKRLPANATIADLIKMGVTNIGFSKKDEPLPDGWYASKTKSEKGQPA